MRSIVYARQPSAPCRRRGSASLLLAAMLACTACGSATQRAERAMAEGDERLDARDMGRALAAYGRATRLDGNNVDAWLRLGRAQLQAGDPTGADQSFQRAQELAPDNIEALDNLVILSVRGGEVDRAKQYLDTLQVLQPDDPAGLLAQGTVALRERRPADALAVADRLVGNYPDLAEGLLLRSRALAGLDRRRDAVAALEAWLKVHGGDPRAGDVLRELLDQHRSAGDVAAIRDVAGRLHALEPGEPRFALEVARAARAAGRAAEADATVAALLVAHPGAPDVARAVLAWWRDQLSPGEARRRALALADAQPPLRTLIAGTLIDWGQPAAALAMVPLPADPQMAAATLDAHVVAARALAALGRGAAARAEADRILAFDPGNVPALLVRARLALAARDFAGALADAQLARSSDASSEDAAMLVPRIHAAAGDPVLAQQAYALGVQAFPDSYAFLSTYLDWLGAAHRPRDAMQAVASFARRHPRHAPAWRRMAALCADLGDPCLIEARAGLGKSG